MKYSYFDAKTLSELPTTSGKLPDKDCSAYYRNSMFYLKNGSAVSISIIALVDEFEDNKFTITELPEHIRPKRDLYVPMNFNNTITNAIVHTNGIVEPLNELEVEGEEVVCLNLSYLI